jgi:hypothetical protein
MRRSKNLVAIPPIDRDLFYFYDDFFGFSYDKYVHTTWGSGGGAGAIVVGLGGQFRITTGTAGNFQVVGNDINHMYSQAQFPEVAWRGKTTTLTNYASEFGWAVSHGAWSGSSTTKIVWLYDSTVSANWQCQCMDGSSVTTYDTSVAADTNWHDFRIKRTASGCLFLLDFVSFPEVTTNIPIGDLGLVAGGKTNTGGSSNTVFLDYVEAFGGRA